MIVRSLDSDGDWNFGRGRNDYLSANNAIVQNVSTRLKSFLGDCFFALSEGVDWFNLIGSKNELALELAVRATILNTDGVTGLVDVSTSLDRATRALTISYTITTIYSVNNVFENFTGLTSFLLTEDYHILATESDDGITTG